MCHMLGLQSKPFVKPSRHLLKSVGRVRGGELAVCNNLVARPAHFKGLFSVTISIVCLEPGPRP